VFFFVLLSEQILLIIRGKEEKTTGVRYMWVNQS